MYRIKIEYRTGDSFSSEDTSGYLDGEWKDTAIVAENLERIATHYKWYQEVNNYSWKHAKKIEIPVPACVKPYEFCKDSGAVILLTDDRVEYQVSPFWCGYFETLYSASAEVNLRKEFR